MAIEFLNSVDFNQNQLIAPVIENLGTEPGSPSEGQMYYNNTGGSTDMYFWNGSAFVSMTGGMSNWILRDDDGSGDDVTISNGVFVEFAAATGALGTNISGSGTTGDPYKMTITSPNTEYSVATTSALGLVKLGSDTTQSTAGNTVSSTASRSYKIQLNGDNQMLVNVPWTDTNTEYSMMTASVLGLGKLFSDTQQDTAANSVSSTASRTYGIQANSSDQLVVNVPWTDTNTEYSAATASVLGLMKLFSDTQQDTAAESVSSTASRTYGIQFNSSDQAVVNVPWSDTNTQNTYVLDKAAGSTDLKLFKNGSGSAQDTITFSGTSNEVTVTGASEDAYVFGLPDDVTIAGELTVSGTGQSSFAGQVTIPETPTADTDAASKGYVDGLVSGGLTFKGTFRADSGLILSGTNSGSYLYQLTGSNFDPSAARVAVAVGDYYVVANTGGNFYGDGGTGTCATTSFLDVGDAVIGVSAASANASVCSDWSLVSQGVVVNSVTTTDGTYIDLTPNSATTGAVTVTADLSATDNASSVANTVRFLDKNNKWSVPAYTTNTDETYDLNATTSGSDVNLNLTSTSGTDDSVVKLAAGSNITLTRDSATQVTIASTDTGALGVSILLNSGLAYVGKAAAGGLTTFAVNVANANVFGAGKTAVNVKCEVIDASTSGSTAGQTVFADVTRGVNAGGETYGTASLNIAFAGTVADSAYRVLLTYVG
tara:strand:- start:1637 stop:3772 length:2136 start_codon:yes stop_codon:yes gene_type:complete